MECKKTPYSQYSPEDKEQSWKTETHQDLIVTYSNQSTVALVKELILGRE